MIRIATVIIFSMILLPGFSQVKLNGPLIAGGYVSESGVEERFKISPSGDYAVYIAKQDNNSLELYSTLINGGTSVKLSNSPAGVGYFKITPDNSKVIYSDNNQKLYSVSITGGTPVQLASTYYIYEHKITPNSDTVIFIAESNFSSGREIFHVPVNGGTPTKYNPPLVAGGDVSSFEITSDGSKLVYVGSQDVNNVDEIYSVPVAGGTVTKLNGPMVNEGDVKREFLISEDNTRVVYAADQDTDETTELYSVSINGGTPVKLNGNMVNGGDANILQCKISGDNTTVVYAADQDVDGTIELYSVPLLGGAVTKLNPAFASGSFAFFPIISDATGRVVYRVRNPQGTTEIYSVPIGGGTSIKLNGNLVSGGTVHHYFLSSNDSTVVYLADQDTDNTGELYSVPVQGGAFTKLNPAYSNYQTVVGGVSSQGLRRKYAINITPDGKYVIYNARQDTDGVTELYKVPINGGTSEKLNATLPFGRDVSLFYDISSDSKTVIYRADQDTDNVFELYAAAISTVCNRMPGCTPIPTTSGLFTAVDSTRTLDGFTHYLDASDNVLLSIKVPAGWTIPADAVSLEIGATPVTFYNQYCGGTQMTGCFVSNTVGAPILNRKWHVDPTKITQGGFAFIDVIYYFTDAEYQALNAELTNQGLSTLNSFTEMQMYKTNDFANALGAFPSPNNIAPWSAASILLNGATPSTIYWQGTPYPGPTSGYSAHFKLFNFNGGGAMGGVIRN